MNIYFDFEATQFSDHIIAIGATCENGDFDCLVSSFKKKITPFITELTGITKEMVENAPTADEAFADLHNWICEVGSEDEPVFYHCYGDGDKGFLHKTAEKLNNPVLVEFAHNLADSLIDDSKTVCRFFHTKAIGVYKALRYFEPELPEQDHDPLNDAISLSRLITYIKTSNPLEEYPFVENDQIVKTKISYQPKGYYYITAISTTDIAMKPKFFDSYGEAATWLTDRLKKKSPTVKRENVLKRMTTAIEQNKNYAGFDWLKTIVKQKENTK